MTSSTQCECDENMMISCLCALSKKSMSKYPSSLVRAQDNLNLGKITASHFWVLNTQNANENMPNMIPIAYLNETLMDCNENLAWGKQEPLIHPYMIWYTKTVRK